MSHRSLDCEETLNPIQSAGNLDTWANLLSRYFVPVEAHNGAHEDNVTKTTSRFFSGKLIGRRWSSKAMAQLSVNAHAVSRQGTLGAAEGPGYFKLAIQGTGRGIVMQDGKEAVLETGEFAFFDASRPYTVLFDDSSTSHILLFPRQLLHLPFESADELSVMAFGQGKPLSRIVTSFSNECVDAMKHLSGPVARRLADNLIHLLGTVIANELYSGGSDLGDRHRKQQVMAYVEEHLEDPGLNPQAIAAAHFISVRSLHQLFENENQTIAATIRSLRLERCRMQLEDPSQDAVLLSSIAAQWGFADSAHFSRAFRQAYGATPSQWRAMR